MEYAVYDDAMEFVCEGGVKFLGIFADAFYADEDVTFYGFIWVGKGDYVGVGVVVEVFEIDAVEVGVATKNEVDKTECSSFAFNGL